MHLHFASSFGFDNVYPRFVKERGNAMHGQLYLGLKGFLETLELHLGCVQIDVHDALRISQYKKGVQQALVDQPGLYIAASYEVDAWGTARQLLLWRDELQLGRWNFKCNDPQQKRLYTLSIIESQIEELYYGVNDRWREIIKVIEKRSVLPIKAVTFYEPRECIHPFFKQLAELLESKGVSIHWKEHNYSARDNDLGAFKNKLSTGAATCSTAKGDGSLIILEGDNEQLIADALSHHIKESEDSTLLLLPERGEVLERSLVQSGFPALGYMSVQSDSALEQLITLITVFLWKPIHPEKITQYLTLPTAPISRELRNRLAEAYANKQGIDNDEWKEAISKYCEKFNHDQQKVEAQLEKWFGRKKYSIHQGVPQLELIELYRDLSGWSRVMASNQNDEQNRKAFLRLHQSILDLIKLIQNEGDDTAPIKDLDIQKWINALERGTPSKAYQAEIGSMQHITHPANITQTASKTIWWNFLDQGNPLAHDSRWSRDELSHLEGVYIHTSDQQLELWYWQLCHTIQMTSDQLILCIPKKSKGEEKDTCPLYADLVACFDTVLPLTKTIDLSEGIIKIQGSETALHLYDEKKLPQRTATWKIEIDKGDIKKRDEESYSSLHKLYYYPYAYYLNYILKIRPVNIPEIRVTPLLLGNLAHHTAELLWQDVKLWDYNETQLTDQVDKAIEKILSEEGAVFEMEKNTISRKDYKQTVRKSLVNLVQEIKSNGWTVLSAEEEYKVRNHIQLKGYVDLVLQRNDEIAIVDLKWGGATRRKKELQDEQELQLIVYDQLLKPLGKKVYLHYYIITKSTFLSRTNEAFTSAEKYEVNEDLIQHKHDLWNRMVRSYEARWAQLKNGLIEVGDGLHKDELEELAPFYEEDEDVLKMPLKSNIKEEDKYSDYKNLIGRL